MKKNVIQFCLVILICSVVCNNKKSQYQNNIKRDLADINLKNAKIYFKKIRNIVDDYNYYLECHDYDLLKIKNIEYIINYKIYLSNDWIPNSNYIYLNLPNNTNYNINIRIYDENDSKEISNTLLFDNNYEFNFNQIFFDYSTFEKVIITTKNKNSFKEIKAIFTINNTGNQIINFNNNNGEFIFNKNQLTESKTYCFYYIKEKEYTENKISKCIFIYNHPEELFKVYPRINNDNLNKSYYYFYIEEINNNLNIDELIGRFKSNNLTYYYHYDRNTHSFIPDSISANFNTNNSVSFEIYEQLSDNTINIIYQSFNHSNFIYSMNNIISSNPSIVYENEITLQIPRYNQFFESCLYYQKTNELTKPKSMNNTHLNVSLNKYGYYNVDYFFIYNVIFYSKRLKDLNYFNCYVKKPLEYKNSYIQFTLSHDEYYLKDIKLISIYENNIENLILNSSNFKFKDNELYFNVYMEKDKIYKIVITSSDNNSFNLGNFTLPYPEYLLETNHTLVENSSGNLNCLIKFSFETDPQINLKNIYINGKSNNEYNFIQKYITDNFFSYDYIFQYTLSYNKPNKINISISNENQKYLYYSIYKLNINNNIISLYIQTDSNFYFISQPVSNINLKSVSQNSNSYQFNYNQVNDSSIYLYNAFPFKSKIIFFSKIINNQLYYIDTDFTIQNVNFYQGNANAQLILNFNNNKNIFNINRIILINDFEKNGEIIDTEHILIIGNSITAEFDLSLIFGGKYSISFYYENKNNNEYIYIPSNIYVNIVKNISEYFELENHSYLVKKGDDLNCEIIINYNLINALNFISQIKLNDISLSCNINNNQIICNYFFENIVEVSKLGLYINNELIGKVFIDIYYLNDDINYYICQSKKFFSLYFNYETLNDMETNFQMESIYSSKEIDGNLIKYDLLNFKYDKISFNYLKKNYIINLEEYNYKEINLNLETSNLEINKSNIYIGETNIIFSLILSHPFELIENNYEINLINKENSSIKIKANIDSFNSTNLNLKFDFDKSYAGNYSLYYKSIICNEQYKISMTDIIVNEPECNKYETFIKDKFKCLLCEEIDSEKKYYQNGICVNKCDNNNNYGIENEDSLICINCPFKINDDGICTFKYIEFNGIKYIHNDIILAEMKLDEYCSKYCEENNYVFCIRDFINESKCYCKDGFEGKFCQLKNDSYIFNSYYDEIDIYVYEVFKFIELYSSYSTNTSLESKKLLSHKNKIERKYTNNNEKDEFSYIQYVNKEQIYKNNSNSQLSIKKPKIIYYQSSFKYKKDNK